MLRPLFKFLRSNLVAMSDNFQPNLMKLKISLIRYPFYYSPKIEKKRKDIGLIVFEMDG